MKIGNSVKVKQGILCPDNTSIDLSGWEGRIISIDGELIEIEWDSITLSQIPNSFIWESVNEELEYTTMTLALQELDISSPRDKKDDVERMQNKIASQFSKDEIDKRVAAILKTDNLEINEINLQNYYQYLKTNIEKPCILTGMQDFDWEEPYLLGGWSKSEYEQLKKVRASYKDHFEFTDFEDDFDDFKGLIVKVKRRSDNKKFSLPLWDLVVIDKSSKNYQLISDYSFWMTNYQ